MNDNRKQLDKRYIHAWDLSLECPAISIFDIDTYELIKCIFYRKIGRKQTHGQRLRDIYLWAEKLKLEYPPEKVYCERGFSRFNTATQTIYRCHGIINMLYYDVDFVYYPPKTIKEAILNGNATKKQIQDIMKNKFKHIDFSEDDGGDMSDSAACGCCALIKDFNMTWNKNEFKTRKKATKKTGEA